MTPPTRGTEEEHESDVHPDPKRPVALSRVQQRLHDALSERGERLGAMYLGGLQVLQDAANPDRIAQSAHSMRELMEKIGELEPRAAEGSRNTGSMKSRAFNLKSDFEKAKRNSKEYSGELGGWEGFDGHLRRFLGKVADFFDWIDSDRPLRRELLQRTMVRLDASGRTLPQPLLDRRYRDWKEMVDFFQNTSHHRSSPSLDQFRERIGELEAFLSTVLVPTTFDDLDAIDTLLKESGNA